MIKILITEENSRKDEVDLITLFFEMGLKILHLRKPTFSKNETKRFLEKIPDRYHSKIVTHQHHELISSFNLKGIHYKSTQSPIFLKKNITHSLSTHNYKEVDNSNDFLEYVFLSPIFNSISKKNYPSTFETKELKSFLTNSQKKVIALGGLQKSKLHTIQELGFNGGAFLGEVWKNDSSKKIIKQFEDIFCT